MRFLGVLRRRRPSDQARRRGRLWRWTRRLLACVAGLVVAATLASIVALHCLDQPWLKRRVQALVHASAGLDIDYGAVRLDVFSGVQIDGVVVQCPAELRLLTPDLVRVGRLDARWSLGSLLGRGPRIQRLAVSEIALTVLVDEHGRTSFDALSRPSSSSAPGAPVPLSRQASRLLAAPPIGALDVEHVTLAMVRTEDGHVLERSELRGLAARLATRPAGPGAKGWRVDAELGSSESPLELDLVRERGGAQAGAGRAKLRLDVDATSSALNAILDVREIEQTFAPSIPGGNRLHAEAHVRFDATAGRTEVTLEHAEAGEGTATVDASFEIPDVGDAIVRHAQGDLDLARLLPWVPAGMMPIAVTAGRAQIRYQVDSLVVGPILHMADGGKIALDVDLSDVAVGLPPGALRVAGGAIALRGQPAEGGGVAGVGSIHLTGVRLESGEERLGADDLVAQIDARQGADGGIHGSAVVTFARVERAGASPVVARDGHVELRVEGLHPDASEPRATRGELALLAELSSLDVRSPGARVIVDGLTLRAHTALEGHPPYSVELEAPVSRLRVFGASGIVLADAPARLEVRARDVQPDAARPAASRGVVHLVGELGDASASLDATKGADALDFEVGVTAGSLGALGPLLPRAVTGEVPLARMALRVRSKGRVEHLDEAAPALRQKTEIDVERPAFENVDARSLSLTLESQGTTMEHRADVELRAKALAFDGGRPIDEHVMLSAAVDRARPSLRFQLATEGHASAKVAASLSFDAARRALLYEAEGHFAGLGPLTPLAAKVRGLDAFDLSQLEMSLSARGALTGVVGGIGRDGTIALEASPERAAAVEGKADVRAAHLRWTRGDIAIATPALAWHGDLRAVGTRRTLDSRLEVGTLHVDLGSHDVELSGMDDEAHASLTGDLGNPEVELTQRLSVRAVEQDVVPGYPLGDLALAVSAERGTDGGVQISDMTVANGSGGTAIAVAGNVDLGQGRRTLSVTTSLTQDLARLSTLPERFIGRGKLAVEAKITSPDLAHYTVRAAVKGQDVTVRLPRAGIAVNTANGEVPVTLALEVGGSGVALQRVESRSPYSMLRFADQHPLLSRSGFLAIRSLETPYVSIAPLVGNLEIDQNVVSLRQFELGVRGGTVTGQCGVVWDGPRSTFELHVRASGVQSSHGEPFDGNIAVAFSAADRTVEGRAQILRIGERHLLDLLDLQDPLHVDPSINRIRTALAFGYPDSLRLVFDHGFASAHLELGGLARFVSVGDLRGIPMGPIVDKMLAPVLDGPHAKEVP